MASENDLKRLHDLIRAGSAGAVPALKALPSVCVLDEDAQSPFNVAIQASHTEAIETLLTVDEAREFAPAVHPADRVKLIKTIYGTEQLDDVELAESRILRVIEGPSYWQRTPLLQACRYAQAEAIDGLVACGAKLNAKDLLGETPLSLCLKVGGIALARQFVGSCIAHKKNVPVTEELLAAAAADKAFLDEVLTHGKLTAKTKRFVFNLACSTLDRTVVERMLNEGFDVNAALTRFTNPVVELINSQLAWTHEVQGWEELAAGYAHFHGHPQAVTSHVPPDTDMSEYNKLFAQHKKLKASTRRDGVDPTFMSDEHKRTRLDLLDLLVSRGLNVAEVRKNLNFPLAMEVICTNDPDFVHALAHHGFRLAPDEGGDSVEIAMAIDKRCYSIVAALEQCGHRVGKLKHLPAGRVAEFREWQASGAQPTAPVLPDDVTGIDETAKDEALQWELGGESVLHAVLIPDPPPANQPCIVRLTHSNVYGPLPEMRFDIRVRDSSAPISEAACDSGSGAGWQSLTLVEERVLVDDEFVDPNTLDEPLYGETPWEGTFEGELELPAGNHRIEIKINAPNPDEGGVLTDWFVEVN